MAPRPPRLERGFTLLECLVACTVAVLLTTLALPSLQGHLLRSGRLDAVAALNRVQAAQEAHRNLHGLYASELRALGLRSTQSPQGLYDVAVAPNGAEGYRATATARGRQAGDSGCAQLTLDVVMGFPSEGPTPGCWQR